MPVRLQNLTRRPVVLRLATGDSLRLAPRQLSGLVRDVEVERSAPAEHLVQRGMVAVRPVEDAPSEEPVEAPTRISQRSPAADVPDDVTRPSGQQAEA